MPSDLLEWLMSYVVDFGTVSTVGLESSPVAAAARRPAGERGPLLQEQVRPRLHGGAGEQRQEDHRLGAPHPQGRARHRHRVSPARGDGVPGREHPDGLRVLRERAVDQRHVRPRRPEEAGGRVQALRRDGGSHELASKFKFARQKSKLAGTIRGSYFVIKHEY